MNNYYLESINGDYFLVFADSTERAIELVSEGYAVPFNDLLSYTPIGPVAAPSLQFEAVYRVTDPITRIYKTVQEKYDDMPSTQAVLRMLRDKHGN